MNESEIFDQALKFATPDERAAYLDAVCAGNPQLRADVEGAVRAGRIDYEESGRLIRFFEEGLHGYTYLEGKG